MASRIETKRKGENARLQLQDSAATNFSYELRSSQRSQNNPFIDDLIGSLANSHENARARQVNEWERMSQLKRVE